MDHSDWVLLLEQSAVSRAAVSLLVMGDDEVLVSCCGVSVRVERGAAKDVPWAVRLALPGSQPVAKDSPRAAIREALDELARQVRRQIDRLVLEHNRLSPPVSVEVVERR